MGSRDDQIHDTAAIITTSQLTILHPLSDVAGFQAISAEIEQRRNKQHHQHQEEKETKQQEEENEYNTDVFDQTMISDVVNTKYSCKLKWRRRVLHGESVRKEVLSTYSIACPIHSFIVFGEEDDDSAAFSEEAKVHDHAERLSVAEQPKRNATQYLFRDEFGKSLRDISAAANGDGNSNNNNNNNNNNSNNSLSQQQLVTLVEKIHQHLKDAWVRGEKVQNLRVAIQAAGLLSKRLQVTAEENSDIVAILLKKGIDASDDLIPSEAVELCYNWFLKINSIRELLPRICIEVSLLRCFRYMTKKTRVVSETVVQRLAMQIRGIADPLVAAHFLWYLCAAAMNVFSKPGWATTSSLDQAVLDTLEALEHIPDEFLETIKSSHGISRLDYLDLFIPSLQW
ncbi:hypothetical protein LSM04_001303 [Trypanosoma melophagium]|uniref:uncharacterized protein n=1 Tax=Trypanosoma melophagium TaxID=715481 RepID=UPI00351A64AA|nr:hypothetical protein LSM04_001303 [Trypanosoma melophagium]